MVHLMVLARDASWAGGSSLRALKSFITNTKPAFTLTCGLVIVAGLIVKVLYNVLLHPLRRFPGPIAGKCTVLYRCWRLVRGSLQSDIRRWHNQYGPIVRVAPDELSFIKSQAWKDIYSPFGSASAAKEMVKYSGFYRFAHPSTPDHIASADFEKHAELRRKLTHGFSAKSLRDQGPIIERHADLLVQQLQDMCLHGAESANMRDWYDFFSFDVIGVLSFGSSFGCLETSDYHPWIKAITGTLVEFAFLQSLLYLGLTRLVHAITGSSLLRTALMHERLTKGMLQKRFENATTRLDFVGCFTDASAPLTFSEVESNIYLLLMAGSETTSSLLAGLTALLLENATDLKRLEREVRSHFATAADITCSSVKDLVYMEACLHEALRLYPPVPVGLPRVTPDGGAVIAGEPIPPNTTVSVPHWVTYRSEYNFSQPDRFLPTRFLDSKSFAQDDRTALQPFGVGHRACVGRNLAFAEVKVVLTKLLFTFDLAATPSSGNWMDQKIYITWQKPDLVASLKLRT
ncbi:hypothetical protein HIM_06214 [Hirsutella minnesotensis 3608]|uniref:Isotrichodermin C-15 hydroxylase n=1 Tax=Hirsutella minnesotensis 3608 TaxID=1043627 RepID=A0A0F8A4Y8_9HYPO|nr:hypothetical protein HIM_06214 [Hirsutella minnesotensis 3608]